MQCPIVASIATGRVSPFPAGAAARWLPAPPQSTPATTAACRLFYLLYDQLGGAFLQGIVFVKVDMAARRFLRQVGEYPGQRQQPFPVGRQRRFAG